MYRTENHRLPLLLILFLAFTLRLLSALFLTGSIDTEGAEYARIAENLLNGMGYVGMATPGTELMFPPLFPLLIAAVSVLTHQPEIAGRLISITTGTLLVLPVFYIALHLYRRNIAYVAAILAACHPLLVGYASTVLIETTYITLVLSGAYWSLRCLSLLTARAFLLAGFFFGLAYLCRPEAALYPLLTILFLATASFVTRHRQVGQVARRCSLLLAVSLILASPYVAWLSVQTGQFRWEGKTPLNYPVVASQIAGINPSEVEFAISEDLEEKGIWNRSNLSVIKSTEFNFAQVIHTTLANAPSSLSYIAKTISGIGFGSPPLLGLVVLGLFGKPWDRELMISQFYLLFVLLGVPSLSSLSVGIIFPRYLLLFLPVMIIWASNGAIQVSDWASATWASATGAPIKGTRAVGLVTSVALILLTASLSRGFGEFTLFDYRSRPVKEAGKWLAASTPGPKTVMDGSGNLAFHAGASFLSFPYSDSSLALKYIDKKKVDFIVLRDGWLGWLPPAPYAKDWLENGIPDRRAQLIYSERTPARGPARGRILIYKWNSDR
jgi:4-amino-4-deoxy-L-arabinose transferase-like glycosyltransferase